MTLYDGEHCITEPFDNDLQVFLGLGSLQDSMLEVLYFIQNSTKGFPEETRSQLPTDWKEVLLLNMAR